MSVSLPPVPRSKVVDAATAIGTIPDGSRVAFGGFAMYQKPMALVREIIRQRKGDLCVVGVANGPELDLLAAAGCAVRVETSYAGLEVYGLARCFRRAVEAGALTVVDYPELASWDRFRADEENLAFWPCAFLGGNDVLRLNPDIRAFPCPITGRTLHAIPAARPDVVLLHAIAADAQGNVILPARRLLPQNHDVALARSCDRVIVSVERIVDRATVRRYADHVQIPSYRVEAVVELPWGSHPTPLLGRYLVDDVAMQAHVAAAASDGTMQDFLARTVFDASHDDYLAQQGASRLAALTDLDMPL